MTFPKAQIDFRCWLVMCCHRRVMLGSSWERIHFQGPNVMKIAIVTGRNGFANCVCMSIATYPLNMICKKSSFNQIRVKQLLCNAGLSVVLEDVLSWSNSFCPVALAATAADVEFYSALMLTKSDSRSQGWCINIHFTFWKLTFLIKLALSSPFRRTFIQKAVVVNAFRYIRAFCDFVATCEAVVLDQC